ncbi:D-amino-acid dehydrogenase [Dendryphion nanum]|uniref:D-amino-acid dehydrogenase n=1 Tax=Dendryphion nanum TaxID=256645 RepID=A0A9P9DK46_9PLEO|nr:D-amino-acid dehydrogenase [Dendryphion nanum]
MSTNDSIVILGGGIIGLSIAYYISQSSPNRRIYIIDSAPQLLESASGYAGGFLARDWFDPRAAALGSFSFKLHRELAESFDGQSRWGYAGSHVYSLSLDDAPAGVRGEDWLLAGTSRAEAVGRRAYGHVNAPGEQVNQDGTPAWIAPQEKASWNVIANAEDCAQVEPRRLCEFLLDEGKKRGVEVLLGTKTTAVIKSRNGGISGVKLESTDGSKTSKTIQCTDIIVASGCWAPRVIDTLFPKNRINLGIDPLAGHSLLFKTPRYPTAFRNIEHGNSGKYHGKDKHTAYAIYCPPTESQPYSPEAYARLNINSEPEIWIGGLNSSTMPLPELATMTKDQIDPESISELRNTAIRLCGLVGADGEPTRDDLEILKEGLCFRPISKSGVPIIGRVPSRDLGGVEDSASGAKVWIAGGHGPWGISMALGTGVVMSDLLSGREPRVDISALRVSSTTRTSKL